MLCRSLQKSKWGGRMTAAKWCSSNVNSKVPSHAGAVVIGVSYETYLLFRLLWFNKCLYFLHNRVVLLEIQ